MRRNVVIQDGKTHLPTNAAVKQGVSEIEAEEVDHSWQSSLVSILKRIAIENPSQFEIPEHGHWSWQKKVAAMAIGDTPSEFFAVECEGEVQGMMAITIGQPCSTSEHSGELLVYVEFISTAPWNLTDLLRKLKEPPRYRGVGMSLLTIAVEYSKRIGYGGKLGLHALPQAERFYRNTCGMTDLGIDSSHGGLRCFEFTAEKSEAFLR